MIALPVSQIVKTRPEPGEVVVVTAGRDMEEAAMERLRERIERAFARAGHAGVSVLVLPPAASLDLSDGEPAIDPDNPLDGL